MNVVDNNSIERRRDSKRSEDKKSELNSFSLQGKSIIQKIENESYFTNNQIDYKYKNSNVDRILQKLSKISTEQRKEMLQRHHKLLLFIDSLCCIINICVLTAMYFEVINNLISTLIM